MDVRHSLTVAVCAAVAALAGACGQGGPAAAPAKVAAAGSPATPAPVVHATESNPPGDIPDNTVFVAYRAPGQPYEVKVPEGWARTDLPTGASFTDKLNSVRVEVPAAHAAPTEASIRNEIPAGKEIRKVDTVSRKGGTAIRVIYRTDSPPDPVTGKVIRDEVERYEFYRDGHVAVLALSGPVGADNVDPWRTISDSFQWK
ncbi:hypothetical protein J5X84_35635 [Streptosporangiaceae bacterium NEAU-GS5]|nr:hypothetical protein [Streptosporangiaceae bacterium NEAU-GS5]